MTLLEKAQGRLDETRTAFLAACDAAEENTDDTRAAELERELASAESNFKAAQANENRMRTITEARKQAGEFPDRSAVRVREGHENLTYSPRGDNSFFRDLVKRADDPKAQQRISRHMDECDRAFENRDITSGTPGGSGVIPPLYLGDQLAEFARPGRPFANAVPSIPMPPYGLSMAVPKVSGGASVDVQSAENQAVSETDADLRQVTAPMVTLAGQQDVSIQLLERSFPGVDVVIYDDLQRAYSSKLDSQLLSGTGLNGQHLGVTQVSNIISVAYNDAAPTGKAAMAKVYDAASQIASNRFEQPNVIVMHPRRAAWFANSYSGSSGSPLLQQGSLMLAAGQQDRGFAGSLGGLPVIVDPNIPTNLGATTNADPVILVFIDDLRLAEEGEQAVRYDAVLSSNLMVRLQLFGFSFFHSARQPKSIAVISGTGFGPPVFT